MSESDSAVSQVGDQSTIAEQGKLQPQSDGPPERGSVRENFKLSSANDLTTKP